MRRLKTTKRFVRDLKRIKKRGKQLDKLWSLVERLLNDQPLEARHRRTRCQGNGSYFVNATLSRTGSLFSARQRTS